MEITHKNIHYGKGYNDTILKLNQSQIIQFATYEKAIFRFPHGSRGEPKFVRTRQIQL